MCGITAYFGQQPLDHAAIFSALAHRGPDARGAWATRLASGRQLHLLHTRLAILDLSAAGNQPLRLHRQPSGTWQTLGPDQPASAADTSGYALAYNGEIYNHTALRAELTARGHTFASHCDTEVLLRGYAEWGRAVFAKLDGMFAAALYDGPAQHLILARDHLGIKPLYYAHDRDGGLLFSSEVRAILQSGLCSPELNPAALHDYLRYGSCQEPRTLFTAIQAFPPGCIGTLPLTSPAPAALAIERYWAPEKFIGETSAPARDWIGEHAQLLRSTVREQLIADVPTGIFLSGGLDSTLLLETAAELDRERITAFTLGGETTVNDETLLAAQTAKNLGVAHKIIRLTAADQTAWVSQALAAMDQPSSDGINTHLVSRASREAGLVVALGGTGADEFHGAYGYAASLSRIHRAFRAAGIFSPLAQTLAAQVVGLRRGPIARERAALLFAQAASPWKLDLEKRRFFAPSQMHAFWPECVSRPSPYTPPLADAAALAALPAAAQITLSEARGYLLNTLLRDSDWATMANHQELRVPFLGRRYVEFMLSVPPVVLAAKNGQKKPLLAGLISARNRHLLDRPKVGFCINYRDLLRGPFRDAFFANCETLNHLAGFRLQADACLQAMDAPRSGLSASRVWALHALGAYLARWAK